MSKTNGRTAEAGVVIDVDSFRAARQEKLGPAPSVKIGGRDFELPREMPASVVYSLGKVMSGDFAHVEGAMRGLFGDNADAIFELAPDWADQEYILESIFPVYGIKAPESAASSNS